MSGCKLVVDLHYCCLMVPLVSFSGRTVLVVDCIFSCFLHIHQLHSRWPSCQIIADDWKAICFTAEDGITPLEEVSHDRRKNSHCNQSSSESARAWSSFLSFILTALYLSLFQAGNVVLCSDPALCVACGPFVIV